MNELYINRPIITGAPQITPQKPATTKEHEAPEISFAQMLEQQQNKLVFSKHATQRVVQREVEISPSNLTRLNEGVRLAQQKGLTDTLILVDKTAFLVNVKDNKVITTVQQDELTGNVFTNIDGAVVI